MKYFYLLLLTCNIFLLTNCSENKKLEKTEKVAASDPFKNQITESEFITVSAKEDNVVEGTDGTRITIPKGSIIDADGNIISDSVILELAEAYSLDEMILSNLTTTSDGKLLETAGMIFFNVSSADGDQLTINPDKPVYVEIPTAKKVQGMMAYKGIRDSSGNMNWIEPKQLENYLVTIDLELLNFLPDGFIEEVKKGLPFRGHSIATKELIDSLYFSLSASDGNSLINGLLPTNLNEALFNSYTEIVNGRYSDDSFISDRVRDYLLTNIQFSETDSTPVAFSFNFDQSSDGIDPAIVKTIKSPEFQNTFIATREFETRLQDIFRTHENKVIELYINNLEKNLWVIDSMVAQMDPRRCCSDSDSDTIAEEGGCSMKKVFENYSGQKLTNVIDASKYSEQLKDFYELKLTEIKKELNNIELKAAQELQNQNTLAASTISEYKDILWKREKYRMETYGFEWTNTGWINIDKPSELEVTFSQPTNPIAKTKPMEVIIDNGSEFDRVYTYSVFSEIKSIYRLKTNNNKLFISEMFIDIRNEINQIISIGYKGDNIWVAMQTVDPGITNQVNLKLEASSVEDLKSILKPYDNYLTENQIAVDLQYQNLLNKEKKRQEKLMNENEYIFRLWYFVFRCWELPQSVALN